MEHLWLHPPITTAQMTSLDQDGGAPIGIFWLRVCPVGGSGHTTAIFVLVSGWSRWPLRLTELCLNHLVRQGDGSGLAGLHDSVHDA